MVAPFGVLSPVLLRNPVILGSRQCRLGIKRAGRITCRRKLAASAFLLSIEIDVFITDSVPRVALHINCVIQLLLIPSVPLVPATVRSDTNLRCLSLGHVAEVADFALVNIGSLPHFRHAIR